MNPYEFYDICSKHGIKLIVIFYKCGGMDVKSIDYISNIEDFINFNDIIEYSFPDNVSFFGSAVIINSDKEL